MLNGFNITTATDLDLNDLVRLLGVLFAIEKDFRPDPDRQRAGLALLLADPARCGVFVARDSRGAVVGMVTAQMVISTAQGSRSVWIEDLVIETASRGRGLGKALLDYAAQWACGHHATRLQLLVDSENNQGIAFYNHLGWERTQLQARRKFLHQQG
ncbi:MAG: GNAT family N-acetyltransferase [Phycisphaerae bacterium]